MSLVFLVLAIISAAAGLALPAGADRDAVSVVAVAFLLMSSFVRERDP